MHARVETISNSIVGMEMAKKESFRLSNDSNILHIHLFGHERYNKRSMSRKFYSQIDMRNGYEIRKHFL